MNYFNFGYYSSAIIFAVIGVLIISSFVFIPIYLFGRSIKIVILILRFIGIIKQKQKKYESSTQNNFNNELGEGRIVDLGEHIGVLTKISKKQIAEDYLSKQKAKPNKNQNDDENRQKEKSYSERTSETMDQEAQAKGWG